MSNKHYPVCKKIEVVDYDPAWPKIYDDESNLIKKAMGDNCVVVHHIGSTAVPGLCAKPKIDLIAVVHNAVLARAQLKNIDVNYRGEYNIPLHHGFIKRGKVNLNVHVYENNHPEIELNLMFRDYLRAHQNARNAYAQLKHTLIQYESSHIKGKSAFTNYTLLKGNFIRSILSQAGFNKIRILKCNDASEWSAARDMRNTYFFKPHNIDDPYTWTFDDSRHAHIVLYQGMTIIGYVHIQFWPQTSAIIRIIVIEQNKRNQRFGSKFLVMIEQWLFTLGIKTIYASSRQQSFSFYLQNGYAMMPFTDPDLKDDEHDHDDIMVGKNL